jgi:DNA-binding winged helix-turn-helix (wHTH) protein/TolB-like protein/Tfp pilus assembly protein PilF
VYRFDEFVADPETWRLSRDGQEIHLEPVVLKLLIYLIAHRGRLVTREELMDTVWGDTVISESALTKAVARLRKALDDDSVAPRYIETVRSLGYRFVAAVDEIETPDDADSMSQRAPSQVKRRALLISAAAIVALLLLAVSWLRVPPEAPPQKGAVRSLAVLPLNNLTGDPGQNYYVDGLQDLLITELSQLPGLRVTSRQSTIRYRDSRLRMTDIAGELGVDALVEGSLFRKGGEIEVTVQLIHGRRDAHLWAERYTRDAAHVLGLISDMADAIGSEIGVTAAAGVTASSFDGIGQIDPRAVDAYALGTTHLDRFTPDSIRSAISHFETAVSIEPDFAMAWSGLAGAHAMQALVKFARPRESVEIARAAALRAIEADDQSFSGYSALGWADMWTWDIDSACDSFDKALRLNPSAPEAIHGEADCLMFEGRTDKSIARLRELLVISPFSAMHNFPLPIHLYMERRFDEAIAAATALQVRTPQFPMHWFLARVYWQQGRFDKALEEERLQFEWFGDTEVLVALEEGLETGGPTGAMRAKADVLVMRASTSYIDPFVIAETYGRAGLVDEALHWLDTALENGSYETTYIAFWPHLDGLRDDPRFRDLMARIYGQKLEQLRRLESRGP